MENAIWDEEIKRDSSPGGRGESLANEIREEIAQAKPRPLKKIS